MPERNDPAGPHPTGHASRESADAGSQHHHPVLRHTLRVLACIALVLYFIVSVLLLGLRYIVLPHVDDFRPRIEKLVSDKIHADFRIGKLSPHWSGFQPGIDVADLTIRNRQGQLALNVPHATASVSWRSLVLFEPLLSSMIVERPDVLITREDDGTLTVAGVPVPTAHTGNATFTTWLMRQQAIVLRGGTLRWTDATRDAPELKLSNIRLAILNEGYVHHVALQAPAEGTVLHGPLDFRAQFRHSSLAPAGKPNTWSGNAYISTGPVDLPTLARYIPLPITTYAGRIDNAIWAHFEDGRIQSADGVLSGSNVALRVKPTQPRLDLPVARFNWRMGLAPGDFTLQLHDFHAELGQPPLDDGTPLVRTLALTTLDARFRQQSRQVGQLVSVRGDRIDLGILAEFMRALPLPGRVQNALVRFNPQGLVANYELALERGAPDSGEAATEQRSAPVEPILHYRFKGDLQGISVAAQEPGPGLTPRNHPRAGLPGFENLWGHIDADESHGFIRLDASKSAVTLPGVFDDPRLIFDSLYGTAKWTVAARRNPGDKLKAFVVDVSELGVQNADARAKMTAHYTNPGHGRGALDLVAHFDEAKVNAIARYLPTSISEKTRIYLGHGLQAGISKGATIEIHGDLTKFPYSRDPDAGQFRIVAPFKDGRFDPSPYPPKTMRNGVPNVWPAFDGIDGVFTLKEKQLRFDVARGHYRNFVLRDVNGRIDELGIKGSDLVIEGAGRGPLADLLAYADNSSIGAMSKHAPAKVHAQGPATLALKLTIPRKPMPKVLVAGAIGFENNTLAADNVPPLSALNGKVHFTNRSAEVERLTGRFLGGDLRANGGMREDGRYKLNVAGNVAVDAARGLNLRGTAAAVLERFSGAAPYSLSVDGTRGHLPDVKASSDLTDLAIDLPAPFGKRAGTQMPLRFSLQPGTGDANDAGTVASATDASVYQHAELTLGPLAARYVLRRNPGHAVPDVVRGAIGMNKPADLPAEGVTAAVDVPEFDADAWRMVVQQLRGKAAASNAAAVAAQRADRAESARDSAPANAAATAMANGASSPAATSAANAVANPASGAAVSAAAPANSASTAAINAATSASAAIPASAANVAAAPPAPGGAFAQYLPSRFAVHVGTLTLLKRHWENVIVGASRSGERGNEWQANLASNQVSGHVSWKPGAVPGSPGTLEARLARLVVPAATENDLLGQAVSQPAQNMPSIDLVVNQLIVRGRDLGRLQINAHNSEENGVPVWQLDTLDILNPDAHFTATENWRAIGDEAAPADTVGGVTQTPRRTALDFHVDIKDAGKLLERAGVAHAIKSGEGTLSGNLVWRGGPTKIDFPTLNGNLAVDLRHGQILKVDPGVAKLLGVLSLQSLARFASMDFRDVIGEGLPFTSVTGTGQIQNGIGRTGDFKLVTAPGRAQMQGTVDLAHETQDLRVHVVPTVSAGAGVVVAAIINPFLGLAALVGDIALSHTVESAFARDYAITGSWAKPHVERLHGDQGKMDAQVPAAAH
ncbi:putative exported protein [Paraburkholderia tropica]|uniref:YhdP family phospholipid transporter n=1 Tax=Paraburkholderia tropica TaxID=92647 RepID=UPI001CB38978|nr:AsmA-like C-terminal region-containing protein [Paraburkholderia tropica]CAG9190536.1 putative exported protein [Paraburkholderia tropica]